MEPTGKSPKGALIALGLAGVLLVAMVGYASFRDKREVTGADDPANAQAAADPIESLRAATRALPQDPDAWATLGMALYDGERYPEASAALERATALAPDRASLWSALGEARVRASERDPLPAPALDAFRKALAIDPKDPPSRYYVAVSKDLAGDHEAAIRDWLALLGDTPRGAPWEEGVRRTIEQVGAMRKIDVARRIAAVKQPPPAPAAPIAVTAGTGAIPGPSPEQLRDAAAMAPAEQDAMARGMVARLEERLRAEPGDVARWVMLMRSRMALREPAKASAALRDALAANPGAKAQLDAEARALGVP